MNTYPQLESFLNRFHQFQPEELELIMPCFKFQEIKKGEDFIESGKPVNNMAFILNGIVAACDFSSPKKCISYFVTKNHFFSEAIGLYKREPADLTMRAMTNMNLLVINLEQIEQLDAQIFNLKNTFLAISVVELTEIVKMQNLPRKGNTKTKFLNFRQQYPEIYSQLKSTDIASYLSISPFTASRLKQSVGDQILNK